MKPRRYTQNDYQAALEYRRGLKGWRALFAPFTCRFAQAETVINLFEDAVWGTDIDPADIIEIEIDALGNESFRTA